VRFTRRCAAALLFVVLGAATSCGSASPPDPDARPAASATTTGGFAISVSGNRLVDQDGRTVQLRGVNRSGTQYACTTGTNPFDGPVDAPAIDAIRSWQVTAVRVSLNEQCWLGINGLPFGGDAAGYRRAITDFVGRLTSSGLAVIVDLHWNAPGNKKALGQQPMADRDHAPAFWRSVAATFATNHAVLFDVYNEPHPATDDVTQPASEDAWVCVRDGGNCPGVSFTAAGSQELVDAIRATGAANPIMIGGPQFAGVLGRWLAYQPNDPRHQLVASIHIYGPPPNQTACVAASCWDSTIAPVAKAVPVVIGEMGDMDCRSGLVDPLMDWADGHGVGYLAWGWVTSDCEEPALITDYDGSPTTYGAAVRAHFQRQ
jgi:endoglucanase